MAWPDTVRVFASFAVIIGHYVGCFDNFGNFDNLRLFFLSVGNVGVFLFFTLSGYFVPGSLERAKSLKKFYIRKLIRVVIPFTVSYAAIGMLFIVLGLFDMRIAERSPFFMAMYDSEFLKGIILCMFPIEMSVANYFHLPMYWFVGEWFMGVIIFLYLISPILNEGAKRMPILSMAVAIAISVIIFYANSEEKIIMGWSGWYLSFVRIPEFLFGIILFNYREFFLRHRREILIAAGIWTITFGVLFTIFYGDVKAFVVRFYPLEPRSFLMTIPSAYLVFVFVEYLNKKIPQILSRFNNFSDISYMAMLIQHVIIYLFAAQFNFSDLNNFGIWFMLTIITVTIIFVSEEVKKFSDSVENRLKLFCN